MAGKRQTKERAIRLFFFFVALGSITILALIVVFLFMEGLPIFKSVHNSIRLCPISNPKSIKTACYSINFCDLRSNKFDPNLCACLGKLFRPRSLGLGKK
jgi:hypothetical protein